MKRICTVLSFALLFAGCASDNPSDTNISSISRSESSVSSAAETSTGAEEESKNDNEITLSVTVKKYEDSTLTFEYQGKEYSLEADLSKFRDIYYYDKLHTSAEVSPMIINSGLCDDITAELVTDKELTKIISCDVVKDNGTPFDSQSDYPADWTSENESDFIFKHKYLGHGKYELTNSVRTIYLDMNSLENYGKCYIPEGAELVFTGYLLKNGYLLTDFLSYYDKTAVLSGGGYEIKNLINSDMYGFFGEIVKLTDEKAEIKLNDNKTVCTVSTDFKDGDLKEHDTVMVKLNDDASLYGSGKTKEYDYAVIYTDLEKIGADDPASTAYAVDKGYDDLTFVNVNEIR